MDGARRSNKIGLGARMYWNVSLLAPNIYGTAPLLPSLRAMHKYDTFSACKHRRFGVEGRAPGQ